MKKLKKINNNVLKKYPFLLKPGEKEDGDVTLILPQESVHLIEVGQVNMLKGVIVPISLVRNPPACAKYRCFQLEKKMVSTLPVITPRTEKNHKIFQKNSLTLFYCWRSPPWDTQKKIHLKNSVALVQLNPCCCNYCC